MLYVEYVAFLKFAKGGTQAVTIKAYNKEAALKELHRIYGKELVAAEIFA